MQNTRVIIRWLSLGLMLLSILACSNSTDPQQTSPPRKTLIQHVQALVALIRPATPNTSAELEAQANLFATDGRHDLAEKHYRLALTIKESAWGAAHLKAVPSLEALAAYYTTQKRYANAEPLWRRALTIKDKTLGPHHPDVATTLSKYAAFLRKTGRDGEAFSLEQRAQAIPGK